MSIGSGKEIGHACGLVKNVQVLGAEIPRSEAHISVRRNDEE